MPPSDSVAVIVALWASSRRAIAVVEKELDARLIAALGIPFTTYAVLCTVAELAELAESGAELSQQQIAHALGIDKSNVSRHIEAAVSTGHVASAPSAASRRSKSVTLTPRGRSALTAAESLVGEFADTLDLREAAATTRFLIAIGDAVDS